MTNTLGTDAKARADRISTDAGFLKSVRESAEATNRRIAVDDRMAADQRGQEGFAVTFDGAWAPKPDRKTVLEERKRALKKELREVETEIGEG